MIPGLAISFGNVGLPRRFATNRNVFAAEISQMNLFCFHP